MSEVVNGPKFDILNGQIKQARYQVANFNVIPEPGASQ